MKQRVDGALAELKSNGMPEDSKIVLMGHSLGSVFIQGYALKDDRID